MTSFQWHVNHLYECKDQLVNVSERFFTLNQFRNSDIHVIEVLPCQFSDCQSYEVYTIIHYCVRTNLQIVRIRISTSYQSCYASRLQGPILILKIFSVLYYADIFVAILIPEGSCLVLNQRSHFPCFWRHKRFEHRFGFGSFPTPHSGIVVLQKVNTIFWLLHFHKIHFDINNIVSLIINRQILLHPSSWPKSDNLVYHVWIIFCL